MKTDQEWLNKWNELHCKYIHEGTPKYRNEKMADYLEDLLVRAKKEYYESGDPIMSDKSYDRFEMYLESLRPDSYVIIKVGS